MSKTDDIKKISDFVNRRVNELIPYSSNTINGMDIRETKQLMHRNLQIVASRVRKRYDDKNVLEKIQQLNLNLDSTESHEEYASLKDKANGICYMDYLMNKHALGGRTERFVFEENNPLRAFEEGAANAVKWKTGNCVEKAWLAAMLLREYLPIQGLPVINEPIKVEVFCIPQQADDEVDKSHAFVVIIRTSKWNNPLKWDDETVICDPWDGEEGVSYTIGDAKKGLSKSQQWKMIQKYADDLVWFEFDSFIGPQFNKDGQAHSDDWISRAKRINEKQGTAPKKWWKASSFLSMKRPSEKEESFPENPVQNTF